MKTDCESHCISVTNFRLVCWLPIVAYTYICTFVFDPRVGRYENSKKKRVLIINNIYRLFNTMKIQNILFKTLFYPENIWVLKRDTWNHSQFLFNNFNNDIINHSNHRIFIFTLLTVSRYMFCSLMSDLKTIKSKVVIQNIEKHIHKYRKQHTL
jgi:hypothetical protein